MANPYGDFGVALPFESYQQQQTSFGRGAGRGGFRGGGGGPNRQPHSRPPPEIHLELNKPWINGYLAKQIKLKHELRHSSGQSKRLEDWQSFVKQRENVKSLVASSRSAFFANNPGQEAHWLPVLAMESSGFRHHCGNCEWDFRSDQDLIKHELEEHQTCGLDGCSFTAAAKPLEIHILHMHSSGLYNRVHQGNTPEDIAKWRAERKKNYPSVAKSQQAVEQRKFKEDRKQKYLAKLEERRVEIEAKRKKHAEEIRAKREEQQSSANARRKGGRRGGRKRGSDNNPEGNTDQPKRPRPEVALLNDDDEDALPVWYGDIWKFRGTRKSEITRPIDSSSADNLDISDDEDWTSQCTYKDCDNEPSEPSFSQVAEDGSPLPLVSPDTIGSSVTPSTSLNANLEKSPPDSRLVEIVRDVVTPQVENKSDQPKSNTAGTKTKDDGASKEKSTVTESLMAESDDEGPPEEIAVSKSELNGVPSEPNSQLQLQKSLVKSDTARAEKASKEVERRLLKRNKRPPSLLERLLQSEISKEKDELLQCLRFVCAKNFFGIGSSSKDNKGET